MSLKIINNEIQSPGLLDVLADIATKRLETENEIVDFQDLKNFINAKVDDENFKNFIFNNKVCDLSGKDEFKKEFIINLINIWFSERKSFNLHFSNSQNVSALDNPLLIEPFSSLNNDIISYQPLKLSNGDNIAPGFKLEKQDDCNSKVKKWLNSQNFLSFCQIDVLADIIDERFSETKDSSSSTNKGTSDTSEKIIALKCIDEITKTKKQADIITNKNDEVVAETSSHINNSFISTSNNICKASIHSQTIKSREINQRNKKVWACALCPNKVYTAAASLLSHYRSHAGIKPFACDICGNKFTRRHSLDYHSLIHKNESVFTCQTCNRGFRHPSHFKEHMRKHTGETPFSCSQCDMSFKTRNTYKRHLKARHYMLLSAQGIRNMTPQEILDMESKTLKQRP